MTHRTTPAISFSSVPPREIVAEFSAGPIASDAGLLLLREADKQIGLSVALDAALFDPHAPDRIVHLQKTLLAQRVYAVAADRSLSTVTQRIRNVVDPDNGVGPVPARCGLAIGSRPRRGEQPGPDSCPGAVITRRK